MSEQQKSSLKLPEHIARSIFDLVPRRAGSKGAKCNAKMLTALRMMSQDMRLAVWNAKPWHMVCAGNKSVIVNIASEDPLGDCPTVRTDKLTVEIRDGRDLEHLARQIADALPRLG